MRKRVRKINDEELEKIASDAIDVVIEKIEGEDLELASTVIVLEKTADESITTRIEVEVFSDIPLIPSADEKAAEVIDVARRKIEDELLKDDKDPESF